MVGGGRAGSCRTAAGGHFLPAPAPRAAGCLGSPAEPAWRHRRGVPLDTLGRTNSHPAGPAATHRQSDRKLGGGRRHFPKRQVSGLPGSDGLWVRSIDSGETHPIAVPPEWIGNITGLRWFPDGGKLIAAYALPDNTTFGPSPRWAKLPPRLIQRAGLWPAISPDGRSIAFQNGDPQLRGKDLVGIRHQRRAAAKAARRGRRRAGPQPRLVARRPLDRLPERSRKQTEGGQFDRTAAIEIRPAAAGRPTPLSLGRVARIDLALLHERPRLPKLVAGRAPLFSRQRPYRNPTDTATDTASGQSRSTFARAKLPASRRGWRSGRTSIRIA
jgi:hypothetical protein